MPSRAGLPLLAIIASSGADVNDGVAALHGWGMAARMLTRCSGRVPVLIAATGPVLSGPALLLGPRRPGGDDRGRLRVRQRPPMVETFTGESLDATELGGADVHRGHHRRRRPSSSPMQARPSRPCSTCWPTSRRSSTRSRPAGGPTIPVDRPTPEAGACIPASPTGGYDVRDVARSIVDDGDLLELRARLGAEPRHRLGDDRRSARRHRRQPADVDRRHPRHPRVAEGRPVRRLLRRLRPPAAHPRRHAGLLPRQGPRVARDDPPRRPAGVRVRPGHRAPGGRRPPQGLRRRLHRHGLPHDGQRPLPRLAVGGDRGDGRQGRGRDPPPRRDPRATASGSRRTTRSASSTRTSPRTVASSTP